MYHNERTCFEKINLKLCKQALGLHRGASNLGCRAELGRFPIIKSIIVAMSKYYSRLHSFKKSDLLYHALNSQKSMTSGKLKQYTFTQLCSTVLESLNVEVLTSFANCNNVKAQVKTFGGKVKEQCVKFYKNWFKTRISQLKINTDTKLSLFAHLKKDFVFESYLYNSVPGVNILSRFRLSCHYLPVERGRYLRPIKPRSQRICTLCKMGIGNEYHAMFNCRFLKPIQEKFIKEIGIVSNKFSLLPDKNKMMYMLAGHDKSITPLVCKWLTVINDAYKKQI